MDMKENEIGEPAEIGLRRFSILSVSSTNLSLLEKRLVRSDNELSSQHSRESEHSDVESYHSNAGLRSSSSSKKELLLQTNGSLVGCAGVNAVPDIKIDCSTSPASSPVKEIKTPRMPDKSDSDMNATGLLNVESHFTRSSDAFATLLPENKMTREVSYSSHPCSDTLETADSRDTSGYEASSCVKHLPTQSSVCSINIESCSTDDSQSDPDIDTGLLHSRRNSLSVLNVPRRLVFMIKIN